MFVGDRATVLHGLRTLGAAHCSYMRPAEDPGMAWLDIRCDCKYGATKVGQLGGEQNGCCELRAAYLVIAQMDDDEWHRLSVMGGGLPMHVHTPPALTDA